MTKHTTRSTGEWTALGLLLLLTILMLVAGLGVWNQDLVLGYLFLVISGVTGALGLWVWYRRAD